MCIHILLSLFLVFKWYQYFCDCYFLFRVIFIIYTNQRVRNKLPWESLVVFLNITILYIDHYNWLANAIGFPTKCLFQHINCYFKLQIIKINGLIWHCLDKTCYFYYTSLLTPMLNLISILFATNCILIYPIKKETLNKDIWV